MILFFSVLLTLVTPMQDSQAKNFTASIREVKGELAYITIRDQGFQIINISNPFNPRLVGTFRIKQIIRYMCVGENHAYLFVDNNGILIIDISEPSNPVHVKTFTINVYTRHMKLSGNYLFFCDEIYLKILNVTDPANPVLINTNYTFLCWPYDVFFQNDYAYFICNEKLTIINTSNINSISEVSIFSSLTDCVRVCSKSNFTYILTDDYIITLNTTNPTNIKIVDEYELPKGISYNILIKENNLFLATSSGFSVFNITNPTSIELIHFTSLRYFSGKFDVEGNMVYFISYSGNDELYIYEISDLMNLILVSTYKFWFVHIRNRTISLTVTFSAVFIGVVGVLIWKRKDIKIRQK